MEDIYETELWKKLEKNALFKTKLDDILKKCSFYADNNNINVFIKDDKLIITYHSRVINRDIDCQYVRDTKYEIFLDKDNNLVINEMTGTLRSNYGYDFENTTGGVLVTDYFCEVFDEDGVELGYQGYSDLYDINDNQFKNYKNGFLSAIESVYNPNLVLMRNTGSKMVQASVHGELGRYVRQIRSRDNLGIVISSSCEFDNNGNALSPKEEYYFNTFLSKQPSLNPTRISFTKEHPFAIVDENKKMRFNKMYTKAGLTPKNYKEVANTRFLKELVEEKEQNGKHIPKDVSEKYDLMIGKLELISELKRTR